MSAQYEKNYREFIRTFNRGEFFRSHEILEELWKKTSGRKKMFFQGLIQAAVALHHAENGNGKGAAYEFQKSQEKLSKFFPKYLGVEVAELLKQTEDYLKRSKSASDRCTPLPRIQFSPG